MRLPIRATGLAIAVLAWVPAALGEARDPPKPLPLTAEELALVSRDARLVYVLRTCPMQLRQALDAWNDIRRGIPPAVEPGPCRDPEDDLGRASDEAALDILKILKEAAGQGTSR
jgi:hypothetical protein